MTTEVTKETTRAAAIAVLSGEGGDAGDAHADAEAPASDDPAGDDGGGTPTAAASPPAAPPPSPEGADEDDGFGRGWNALRRKEKHLRKSSDELQETSRALRMEQQEWQSERALLAKVRDAKGDPQKWLALQEEMGVPAEDLATWVQGRSAPESREMRTLQAKLDEANKKLQAFEERWSKREEQEQAAQQEQAAHADQTAIQRVGQMFVSFVDEHAEKYPGLADTDPDLVAHWFFTKASEVLESHGQAPPVEWLAAQFEPVARQRIASRPARRRAAPPPAKAPEQDVDRDASEEVAPPRPTTMVNRVASETGSIPSAEEDIEVRKRKAAAVLLRG